MAPKLTVVTGDAVPVSAWLDFPATIIAASPQDKSQQTRFRLGGGDLAKSAREGRRQPAYEAWSILLGCPPPVPNVERWKSQADSGLTSLLEAHACFQGLERPCAEDDDGEGFLAYILRPQFFYRYTPSMKCVAERKRVADDLLYVAHIRLDQPEEFGMGPTRGVFTQGGFVEADSVDKLLPVDHQSRYLRRLW